MSRQPLLCLALGLAPAVFASGCIEQLPGEQRQAVPAARSAGVPHPMQGIWQGSLSQNIPEAVERPFFGLVAPDGQWLFASFASPPSSGDRPLETIWGPAAQDDQQDYGFRGEVFDLEDGKLSWAASGVFDPQRSVDGSYRVFQGGVGSTAQSQREGVFSVSYGVEYEIGSAVDMIAGQYLSGDAVDAEATVTITAIDEFRAQISGSGDASSQIGACSFSGLLAPMDVRFNAYSGTADLREERCNTGSSGDPAFTLLAYLVTTSDCAPTASNGPNALVLGLRNDSVSHYFHRLCRIR